MDSDGVKRAIMQQAQQENSTANVRTLMKNLNVECFERCVPKPGSSLSSGERTCITQCMEKYMAAWSAVNAAYIRRIQQEVGNGGLSSA